MEQQMEQQLPGHHFMITFTVPEQLRRFIRSHQKIAYAALFAASSAALKKLVADDKLVGGDCPGFFGVLHTWGRQLEYHPHIHYIVPGGALKRETGFWHSSRIDFFLPVRALSGIFRAKFRDEMKKAGLFDQINPDVWQIAWNVNSQAVGSSEGILNFVFSDRQSKCRPNGNHWSKPKQMNNEKPEEGVFLSKNYFRHVEIRQINRNFIPDNFPHTCVI
jgi:hypothetical protein